MATQKNLTVNGNVVVGGAFEVDTMRTNTANIITVDDNMTVNGDLYVLGKNIVESLNPYWVAVVIGFTGGNPF